MTQCTKKNITKPVVYDGMLTGKDMTQFWLKQMHKNILIWFKNVYDLMHDLRNTKDLRYEELGKIIKKKAQIK